MHFNVNFGWGTKQPLSVERDNAGNWFYRMFSSGSSFTSLSTDRDKLRRILTSPAALKAFKLNADLASLGKISEWKDGKVIRENVLKDILPAPNKHQTWRQWMWDYMFYVQMGTADLWRSNSTNLEFSKTSFYWLNVAKVTFPGSLETKLDKLDLSDKSINGIGDQVIHYEFRDGTKKDIKLKEIQPFFDLSNSVSENWYKGNSVIDAIYKVIENSEEAIRSKNVNLRMSKKYMVSGQADAENVMQVPMAEPEKRSIETNVASDKEVTAVKTAINIDRFVDDIAKLKLDDSYIADYFIICSILSIPRDVAEANLKGSTFENQEKSTGKHITYAIQPKVDDLISWLGDFLGIELRITYDHLPFMQIFEKDRAETNSKKAETYVKLVSNGVEPDKAAKFAGIEL